MVVIVGGGICGLAIGWYLARARVPVTIVERGEAGRAATWAAGGILAPQIEGDEGSEHVRRLFLASHALWPAWARELEHSAGMAVDYRSEGTLVVAFGQEGARLLRQEYEAQRKGEIGLEWLSGKEVRRREPHLSANVSAALFSALGHQVDNRKVALALRTAFLRSGGVLREHTPVEEIMITAGRVQGVRAAGEILMADVVVLAAGSWSASIPGLPADTRLPVRPVKGQIVAVRMPSEAPFLRHVIYGAGVYLVPRLDGRLLVGATVEECGFDTQVTAGAVFALLRGARRILPVIDDRPVIEMWAGLRPGSPDGAPILGEAQVSGLIVATGHFRNGILLAPITAESISHLILTGESPEVIRSFSPQRFTSEA
ncbi:MAG: glycine oxidase ThiO [Herpetosiphonaceae bacterium]|nr:MAG: glycine oxidase ThiO [Herpetosiphonaceae bacterium]